LIYHYHPNQHWKPFKIALTNAESSKPDRDTLAPPTGFVLTYIVIIQRVKPIIEMSKKKGLQP